MKTTTYSAKIPSFLALISAFSLILAPTVASAKTSISAIKGKDEKVFAAAPTRCLTTQIKKLNTNALAQMEKDIKKADLADSEAAKLYKMKLEIIWEAMHEPYCGYGSRGVTAVAKSFSKSVAKTRAEFLAVTKK